MIASIQQRSISFSKCAPEDGRVTSLLSDKLIPSAERLIFALDVPTHEEAKSWVEQLGDSVLFYKLGLQILMAGDYYGLISWLRDRGKKVFADIKFNDVPETIEGTVAQLKDRGISFATVHAGNDATLKAASKVKNGVKILAVTVLTSLDQDDLKALGFTCDVRTLVLSRAKRALDLGCDGVISSGLEIEDLRVNYGNSFLIVSPGIRPLENRLIQDDQKRIVTVEEAFLKGADYIVIGRPIRNAPNPKAKAEEIQEQIGALFSSMRSP